MKDSMAVLITDTVFSNHKEHHLQESVHLKIESYSIKNY